MKHWPLALVLCLLHTPLTAGSPPDLLARGDVLAGEKKYAEALLAWKAAYLEVLPDLRGLPFRYPVVADILERSELEKRLHAEIEKEYPEEEIRAETVAFAAFGFFPPSMDLRSMFLTLLTEEVAGYYDPETKMLYLVLPKPRQARWWEKLAGVDPSGFDPDMQKVTLVHEMSHALMDQHYDLFSLHRSAEEDDDVSLAVTALVEGEATLAMAVEAGGERGDEILRADPGFMEGYMKMVMPLAGTFGGGEAFRKSPLILRETLLFPYLHGMVLCLRLAHGGDWQRVNRAFADPPVSTEQILHPEKYLGAPGERDDPVAISLPEGCPLEPRTWELVRENVLGELQVEILLRPRLGRKSSTVAAAGWDGDLFRVYRGTAEPEETCLLWASTWDTEGDAMEIAQALERHFEELSRGAETTVRRFGQDVILVVGDVAGELRERLVGWARAFDRAPKKLEREQFETPVRFSEEGLERSF